MKRHLWCVAVCALVVLAGALCIQAEGVPGGTLVFAQPKDITTTDMVNSDDSASMKILYLIHDQVVAISPLTLEPTPELASSWEWSDEGRTLTMYLVEDVVFHNGEPCTAEDVAYSINRIANPAYTAATQANYKGWFKSAEAVDANTVVVNLEYHYVAALELLSVIMIVPKDLIESIGQEEYEKHPVGTGPFKFVEWIKGERVVLERNDDYWMKTPNLERVIMRPIAELAVMALELETGGVDLITDISSGDYARLVGNDQIQVVEAEGMSSTYYAFNLVRAPMNDIRFREAVACSVDLDGAVKALFPDGTSTRAYGQLPPQSWANIDAYLAEKVLPSYDLDRAKELYRELVADGVVVPDQKIYVWTKTDELSSAIGTILVTGMRQAGFNAEAKPTEWGAFVDVLLKKTDPEGEWDIYVLGSTAHADPDYSFYGTWHSSNAVAGSVRNLQFYMNPAVDALLDASRLETERDVRFEFYKAFQILTMSNYSVFPVYFSKVIHGVSNGVHDYIVDPRLWVGLCNQWVNVWVDQ